MKFRITITVNYSNRRLRFSEDKVCKYLRQNIQVALLQTKVLPSMGQVLDSIVEAERFEGIAYVVTRDGKPVGSYSLESLAQFHVDHDEHPELCEIHEVETC